MAGRWTKRLISVRLEDAAGTGLTVSPMDGDFSGGEENAENAEHVPTYDRDAHDDFVLGRDLVQEISFTVQMKNETITSAVAARIEDFLKKRNFFSALVSVSSTVWAFRCKVTYSDGSTTTTKTYGKCEGTISWAEGEPSAKFTVSLKNHTNPTVA
jgi:hypothetical protein